jgi:hypothetical protein
MGGDPEPSLQLKLAKCQAKRPLEIASESTGAHVSKPRCIVSSQSTLGLSNGMHDTVKMRIGNFEDDSDPHFLGPSF